MAGDRLSARCGLVIAVSLCGNGRGGRRLLRVLTRCPLRIALMGTRGIPVKYGGFETFYENLGPRLAERGHDVFVYVRPHMTEQPHLRRYRGTRLVPLPSIRHKHLETLSHTLLSTLHGLRKRYDVVLICGVGNAPVAWIPRLSGATVALSVDSADWNRTKWGRFARMYLRSSARVATHAVNVVVADNGAIQRHYREDLGAHVRFIAYGAEPIAEPGDDVLRELGVERRGYILWVGRLEPETKVDQLARDALRAAASERAQQFYTWEHIVDQYERLFQEMVRARAGRNA